MSLRDQAALKTLREFNIDYHPLPAQTKFHRSKAKYKAYIGGYGSGKTYAGCHEGIWLSLLNMGLTGMMIAPTYRILEDVVIPTFREILDGGNIAYRHRVSGGSLSLPWGSKVLFRSADNPAHLKGPNLAWVGVDEGALISKEAWDVAISRIRHPDARRLAAFITTTPEGFNWLYDEFALKRRRGYTVIHAETRENVHLPDEYVRDLEAAYDPLLVRQYLMGEFVNVSAGRVYQAFDRKTHVKGGLALDIRLPLALAIDFNVNPLHAAAIQVDGDTVLVVDEIVLSSSNTYELCQEARARFGDVRITAYPDPTGRARKTAGTTEAPSDFSILMSHGLEVRARNCSPHVKDRINAVNRKLMDASGKAGLLVSDRCRETIRSFEQTCYKPGSSQVDKAAGVEHITDAVGYFIEYEFPIRPPSRVEYAGVKKRTESRGF